MRQPTSSEYDAVVDLAVSVNNVPSHAFGLVKRTYVVADGKLALAAAVPLSHDIRRGPHGERPTKLPLGSDFWTYKRLTDVVVVGAACASQPVPRMEVGCQVGDRLKRIAVFGRRLIEWSGDTPRIGSVDSFSSMPIDNAHAYGGIDTRVAYPPIRSLMEAASVALNHPGTYPRNHLGKGYYVVPEPFDGIELPNLEDPDDLLTDDRLVVGEVQNWVRQPMPWTFAWQGHGTFPRCAFIGAMPRHGVASDVTEVGRGILSAGYENIITEEPPATEQAKAVREIFGDRFYQEASAGMQLGPLHEGVPVRIYGMRTDGAELTFALPSPPRLEVVVDSQVEPVEARMSNLVIEPESATVTITYFACTKGLPRKLVPGVHTRIPLSLRIAGNHAVSYVPPQASE